MEGTLRTREILFLPIEHNIHIIFSPPCNILQILKRDNRYTIRDRKISSLILYTDLRYRCLLLNLTIRVDEIYLPFYVFYIMNQSCKIKAYTVCRFSSAAYIYYFMFFLESDYIPNIQYRSELSDHRTRVRNAKGSLVKILTGSLRIFIDLQGPVKDY